MTGIHRKIGLLLAFSALSAPGWAVAYGQDIQQTFEEGVSLLERGEDEAALQKFQEVLAADPSQEQAFALWQSTEHDIWLRILVKRGDYELFARRMMDLSRMGRLERREDADAIRGLIREIDGDDLVVSTSAVRTLSAQHGEFAVPYMLGALADPGNDDRRVRLMHALTKMDFDVVLPLVQALDTDDGFLRSNVARVLGYIGDRRAVPALAALATDDDDVAVLAAANQSLDQMNVGDRNAAALFTRMGDDYLAGRHTVLKPFMYSDVVWTWNGSNVAHTAVSRELYGDELAKKAFHRALALEPDSPAAMAGLVRAYVSQMAKVERLSLLGEDVSGVQDQVAEGAVAVHLAGAAALDQALLDAVAAGESDTSVGLCRRLGEMLTEPTGGLLAALGSGDAAISSEAAIALGRIALTGRGEPGTAVVSALGEAAGREIMQVAAVFDGDSGRAADLVGALEAAGLMAYSWPSGVQGLVMAHRVPGLDLILVADSLPDITTDQVIDDLGRAPGTRETPIVIISADPDAAGNLYGDVAAGVVTGAADLDLDELLSEGLQGDRAQADELSSRAAWVLAALAMAGADVTEALPDLAGTLAMRPDGVTLSAMQALAVACPGHSAGGLVGVAVDGERSDSARSAACSALAAIISRGGSLSQEEFSGLVGVLTSDSSLKVRAAAAHALGALDLDATGRAHAVGGARVDMGG